MAICKMCGQEKKLIDAHIIPKSFFKYLKNGDDYLYFFTNVNGEIPQKKSQQGIYSKKLVCLDCEKKYFSDCDDYIYKILIKDSIRHQPVKNSGWLINNCNLNKVKYFVYSLLWRANESEADFFDEIKLGPYLQSVKNFLICSKNDNPNIGYIFARSEEKLVQLSLQCPHKLKKNIFDGINIYCFPLGAGYYLYIKIDRKYHKIFDLNSNFGNKLLIVKKSNKFNQESILNLSKMCNDVSLNIEKLKTNKNNFFHSKILL